MKDYDPEIGPRPRVNPDVERCEWPGCENEALCGSGNFGGRLVCSDHFRITNGLSRHILYTDEQITRYITRARRCNIPADRLRVMEAILRDFRAEMEQDANREKRSQNGPKESE